MIAWTRADRIAVVASGPSLNDVDPAIFAEKGVTIIAVNGAIGWLPRADYWFSLDPAPENIVRCSNPVDGVRYVMAAPKYTHLPGHVTHLSRIAGGLFGKARAPGGLSEREGCINTGNSAYGALGLAYHMRPAKIALFGVDGSQEARVTGGFPRTLEHLPPLFETAVPQLVGAGIEVVNGSPESAVTCFERMAPQRALKWLLS